MYEREEMLIECAELLAAEATAGLARAGKGVTPAAALSDIEHAVGLRESVLSTLSHVYRTLRRGAPGGTPEARARRDELLPRAWSALLSVEREKDFLVHDLHRLRRGAARTNEH
jgi:hypothetical protein